MTFAVLADVHGNVAPRLRIAATCGIANVTHRLAIVPEARVIYFALSDSPEPYIYRAGIGSGGGSDAC